MGVKIIAKSAGGVLWSGRLKSRRCQITGSSLVEEKLVGEIDKRNLLKNFFGEIGWRKKIHAKHVAQMRLTKKRWCATKRYKIKKLAYARLVVETTRMEKRTSPNTV